MPESTASLFKEKEVDGQVLSVLQEDEIKTEFNIPFGQRKKILMLRDDIISKGKCMFVHCYHAFTCLCFCTPFFSSSFIRQLLYALLNHVG